MLGATIGAVTGLSAANALTAGVGGKHFISLVLSTFTAIIYYIEFSHVLNPPTERSKFELGASYSQYCYSLNKTRGRAPST